MCKNVLFCSEAHINTHYVANQNEISSQHPFVTPLVWALSSLCMWLQKRARTHDENIIKTCFTLFISVNISVSLVRNGGMLLQKQNNILMQATYWELSRGFGLSLFNGIPFLYVLWSFTHSPRPPVWSASSGVKVQPAKTEEKAGRGLIWLSLSEQTMISVQWWNLV